MDVVLCNANSVMWIHDGHPGIMNCMHNGNSRVVSRGPHRVGIRAILTLGDPSLAWALDQTKNYFLKIKRWLYISMVNIYCSHLFPYSIIIFNYLHFNSSFYLCINLAHLGKSLINSTLKLV
jgi:hypothetical protein